MIYDIPGLVFRGNFADRRSHTSFNNFMVVATILDNGTDNIISNIIRY